MLSYQFKNYHIVFCSISLYFIKFLPLNFYKANNEFIEGRRRALKRFLILIMKHPSMCDDHIISYFLSYTGSVS